jgi:hypothetical protein
MATCWIKETALRVDMGEYDPAGIEMPWKMLLACSISLHSVTALKM